MSQDHQGRAGRRRRVRHQASRRHQEHRRRRGGVAGRPQAGADQGGRRQIRHRARLDRARRQPAAAGGRRRDPLHADADACGAVDRLPEGRQARAGRDSARPIRWHDAQAVADLQKQTELVAMCGHTRRFNPSHQWVHKKIVAGEFNIQQMDVQTFFFRRTNMNALGQPRSWTDHLLWHHAAHTVDLFAYQARLADREGQRGAGPDPPDARDRDGHVDPAQGRRTARSARSACRSTMTVRSAPSSATSATPAPTSRATTIWSTARKRRSTSPRSTSR